MNQFNIIDIYMKIVNEKEKKLQEALNQLNSLEIQDQNLIDEIKNLNEQKNQLEIEKKDLEQKNSELISKCQQTEESVARNVPSF